MAPEVGRRERVRQGTIEEIKATARQQIAEDGAANLSLGAIAREMGMTPPALYRYFDSRDALVVALVAEAYDSLGEALESAMAARLPDDYHGRYQALMTTYRHWTRQHREDYALMYGSPVYGTEGSIAQIGPAVARCLQVLVDLFRAAHAAGRLTIPRPYQDPPPSVRQALLGLRIMLQDVTIPLAVLAQSLTAWLQIHGLIWQELHGVLPESLFDTGELYHMEVDLLAERLGLAAA
jgi:AcrR family transcriptional regulator